MFCPTINDQCKEADCRDWSSEFQKCWQLIRHELGYREVILSIQGRRDYIEGAKQYGKYFRRLNEEGAGEECTDANPCCDRRGEYNGFATGRVIFECPEHCNCHD